MIHKQEDLLSSPSSTTKKIKDLNGEFKHKYNKRNSLVYDFTCNKYIEDNYMNNNNKVQYNCKNQNELYNKSDTSMDDKNGCNKYSNITTGRTNMYDTYGNKKVNDNAYSNNNKNDSTSSNTYGNNNKNDNKFSNDKYEVNSTSSTSTRYDSIVNGDNHNRFKFDTMMHDINKQVRSRQNEILNYTHISNDKDTLSSSNRNNDSMSSSNNNKDSMSSSNNKKDSMRSSTTHNMNQGNGTINDINKDNGTIHNMNKDNGAIHSMNKDSTISNETNNETKNVSRVQDLISRYNTRLSPGKQVFTNPSTQWIGATSKNTIQDTVSQMKDMSSVQMRPINVIYSVKESYKPTKSTPVVDTPRPKSTLQDIPTVLYGPSVELEFPLSFQLLNTVYVFDKEEERTVYYIQVCSNIKWIIKKDIMTIKNILKKYLHYDCDLVEKSLRDNTIVTLLNGLYKSVDKLVDTPVSTDTRSTFFDRLFTSNTPVHVPCKDVVKNELQYFILTDIIKDRIYKGEYILLQGVPRKCKLVGKALVAYDNNNRVHMIFILTECKVEKDTKQDTSFYIVKGDNKVEAVASCMHERDEWVRVLQEFINKIT